MCIGGASAPSDNSGAIAQQQEAAREATIQQDMNSINKIYGGTIPVNQPANTSVITLAHPTSSIKNAGTYYESNSAGTGGPFPYAVYDGSGNLVGYSGDAATASGSTQSPGGTITGPTTNTPGQFTDDYYSGIANNYENYYDPQLTTQYNNALNSLTYQLGQQGILQSSEGARQLALLQQQDQTQQQAVASQALGAENSAKQQVAAQKASLTALANTAADPSSVASQVATSAASAVSPVQYSPLANAFTGLLGQGTNALAVQQGGLVGTSNGATSILPTFSQPVSGGSSGGSGGSSNGAVVP